MIEKRLSFLKKRIMEIEISKDYNIRRLQQWLDIELSTSMLLLLSWFWNFTIFISAIAAIIFTPFMLKILFEERKFGWIFLFIIFVTLPILWLLFGSYNSDYKFIFGLIVLGLFYFYCFVLRIVIKDWQ